MIIVGLTGSIGSGKTTFADFLSEQCEKSGHWESWQLVAEVAMELRQQPLSHPKTEDIEAINKWLEVLPEIIREVFHKNIKFTELKVTNARLHDNPEYYDKLLQYLRTMQARPELQRVKITEENKDNLRSILQWLGGYLAKKCGGDIWYSEIIRSIESVSGLELATIGGVRFPADAACIKKAGGVIIQIARPGVDDRDRTDITERERKMIPHDSVVHNDGTLDDFNSCAQLVLKDLKEKVLADYYYANKLSISTE